MSERRGNYIEVYGGQKFWPLDPKPEELDIVDIAHSLALMNRFTGHTSEPYSVAEHSVRVCWLVAPHGREAALWGLLHDATEAYLNDLPRPLKLEPLFSFYRELETQLLACVAERFGLPPEIPAVVFDADERLLATEARDLLTPGAPQRWGLTAEPLPDVIRAMSWEEAEQQFMALWWRYRA